MRYCKKRVRMFDNKKLYKKLLQLQESQTPDSRSINTILSEIAEPDPAEFETVKIEVEVEKSKRHMVREVDSILYYEIYKSENYLAKPDSETDPFERKLQEAKLKALHEVLKGRKGNVH